MLQVILLQLAVPDWKAEGLLARHTLEVDGPIILAMVKEVMRQIIADVAKDSSTICDSTSVPVEPKDRMRKPPERGRQHDKERRWHDQPVLVHW